MDVRFRDRSVAPGRQLMGSECVDSPVDECLGGVAARGSGLFEQVGLGLDVG